MMNLARQVLWRTGLGFMLLVGLIGWPLLLGEAGTKSATPSTLRVTPEFHDFGVVKRLGGLVQTTFVVHNQGNTPLKIRRIWTS